ncbi:hypothetical protein [Streptomyces sp. NPDC048392]|uniref:hypothetical protein n=1 Tax=Streptomyces sp. NPDC048392 TaxID=3365543 RepID=UPI0037174E07
MNEDGALTVLVIYVIGVVCVIADITRHGFSFIAVGVLCGLAGLAVMNVVSKRR